MTGDDNLTPDQITAELVRVNRLLAARDGKPGYKQNTLALKARIAQLTALQEAKANV